MLRCLKSAIYALASGLIVGMALTVSNVPQGVVLIAGEVVLVAIFGLSWWKPDIWHDAIHSIAAWYTRMKYRPVREMMDSLRERESATDKSESHVPLVFPDPRFTARDLINGVRVGYGYPPLPEPLQPQYEKMLHTGSDVEVKR
jgi:hypothetical protein